MYILYIRHGESTANLLKKTDPLFIFKLLFHPDAKLTDNGHEQARIMSINIINMLQLKGLEIVPFIFSSILSRSIQTANNIVNVANNNFNLQLKTVVIPHIEEIPLTYNLPLEIQIPIDLQNQPRNLYKILEDNLTNDVITNDVTNDSKNLSFEIIPELNPYDKDGNPILRINIKKFFESLDTIRSFIIKNGHQLKENSVIIIVSHRKTIKEITKLSIGNLGLVLQENVHNEILFDGF